jgi:hypothetical protein
MVSLNFYPLTGRSLQLLFQQGLLRDPALQLYELIGVLLTFAWRKVPAGTETEKNFKE